MIIACTCGARLKVSDEKLTSAGVKIKCPKCATVHLAKRPAADAATAPAEPFTPEQPQHGQAAPEPSMPWFASASPPEQRQQGTLVLIAHDSTVVAEMIAGALQDAGMATDYAPNGLEALKKAMELKPQAMVVDVGLTGIYGFELCERLKSDKGTAHIKIILLSSVYGLTAYKRSPVTLYGADDYIEKHHIPDQLVPKLKKLLFGEPAAAAPTAAKAPELSPEVPQRPAAPLVSRKGMVQHEHPSEPVPERAVPAAPSMPEPPPRIPDPVPAAREPKPAFDIPEVPSVLPKTPVTLGGAPALKQEIPSARPSPPPAPPKPAPVEQRAVAPATTSFADGSVKLDADFFEHEEYEAPAKPQGAAAVVDPAEIEKARRFARLIVSDIALYNQETVMEGIQNGTFFDLLKDDISEGRTLYENRVPVSVRSGVDYLQEAFDNFIASKKKLH